MSTYTPQISPTNCKFYGTVAQVYDVSCAKIAFFQNFWLKGHETPAQVLSCEFCLISQNTYLNNSCERLFFLFFLKFYFFLCEELQGNEDQQFSNYVNANQFKKNTANFHVMWSFFFALFKLIWIVYVWIVHHWIVNCWILCREIAQPNVFTNLCSQNFFDCQNDCFCKNNFLTDQININL